MAGGITIADFDILAATVESNNFEKTLMFEPLDLFRSVSQLSQKA